MKGFVLINIVARFKLNQVVEFVHLIDSLVLFHIYFVVLFVIVVVVLVMSSFCLEFKLIH